MSKQRSTCVEFLQEQRPQLLDFTIVNGQFSLFKCSPGDRSVFTDFVCWLRAVLDLGREA